MKQLEADIETNINLKQSIEKYNPNKQRATFWTTFLSKLYLVCTTVQRTLKGNGNEDNKSIHAKSSSMLKRMRDKMASFFTNSRHFGSAFVKEQKNCVEDIFGQCGASGNGQLQDYYSSEKQPAGPIPGKERGKSDN